MARHQVSKLKGKVSIESGSVVATSHPCSNNSFSCYVSCKALQQLLRSLIPLRTYLELWEVVDVASSLDCQLTDLMKASVGRLEEEYLDVDELLNALLSEVGEFHVVLAYVVLYEVLLIALLYIKSFLAFLT